MYIRASSSYKDAHSGASASGLWEASQNKTMQSYNHIPFYLEHKGFFVTHIPESCVSLFSPRDLNLEHSKAFPSWYHLFVWFFFSPILFLSLSSPTFKSWPFLSPDLSQSYLCFTGFCAFRVGRDGENHCLIKRWGEMR